MKTPEFITNYQKVVSHFGRWPSFHDSNVMDYEPLTRASNHLGFTLHAWNMTSEVDSKGFFILKDHALVSFRFWDISDSDMEKFDSSNTLFGLQFSLTVDSPRFEVKLDSVMGMDGSFSASRGEVVNIISCTSDGKTA